MKTLLVKDLLVKDLVDHYLLQLVLHLGVGGMFSGLDFFSSATLFGPDFLFVYNTKCTVELALSWIFFWKKIWS